ncbi:MAG: photosynthetic reaction center cytochrome PufC [Woeseiaceae bacterium]|nr:photosynthetic reaction center cytochrome PufC [Woeseiaceae bacterium]
MTRRLILLVCASFVMVACERPPIETSQNGYRGTAMVDVSNPRDPMVAMEYPAALPAAPSSGPKAGEVYENVQVLGDLSVAEFTRVMTAITAWVSPEQGCNYCHNGAEFASDDMYTKVVSRRMIEMTQHINSEYESHVGGAGVNCYTCHRGKNVPEYIWFEQGDSANGNKYFMGWRNGQNRPGADVALTSLPSDVFVQYLTANDNNSARVASDTAHSPSPKEPGITAAEHSFAIMANWSQSLGVNCTYCHNSASFQSWEQSTPARTKAHHGLNMVRSLNSDYLIPLESAYPANRLGPEIGDAPKAYCLTCHQGQKKPLGGADAITAYPSLAKN